METMENIDEFLEYDNTPANTVSVKEVNRFHHTISLLNKKACFIVTKEMKKKIEILNTTNQAQKKFIRTINHELRTPSMCIIAGMDLLQKMGGVEMLHNAGMGHICNNIISSVDTLLMLENNILDRCKTDQEGLTVEKNVFSIRDTIKTTATTINCKAIAAKNHIYIYCNPQLANKIVGDETKIQQIMLNIVMNAAKYTHEGDIYINAIVISEMMIIEITDTGPGIDKSDLQKLFTQFSRVTPDITTSGTGLGLNLSKQYAQKMGGDIMVESKIGHGTTFTIKIPYVSHIPYINEYSRLNKTIMVCTPYVGTHNFVTKTLLHTKSRVKYCSEPNKIHKNEQTSDVFLVANNYWDAHHDGFPNEKTIWIMYNMESTEKFMGI